MTILTNRVIYWTEWSHNVARIKRVSMDGARSTLTTLHQNNLKQPYAITIDFDEQVLYWADLSLKRVECSNVDGSNRNVVISSGLERPFDLTLFGDILYVSDLDLGILAANKSGGVPVEAVYVFCDHISSCGIQVIAEERQLLGKNMTEVLYV